MLLIRMSSPPNSTAGRRTAYESPEVALDRYFEDRSLLREGEIERLAQFVVRPIGDGPGIGDLKTRGDRLQPDVVFLVDHQGQLLARADQQAARARSVPQLVADEMPFHQHLTFEGPDLVHAHEHGVLERHGGS